MSDRGVTRNYKLLSKIDSLTRSVNEKHENFSRLLNGSKVRVDRKALLKSDFRYCKEAFFEVASMLNSLILDRQNDCRLEDVKIAIKEAKNKMGSVNAAADISIQRATATSTPKLYLLLRRRNEKCKSHMVKHWKCLQQRPL